MVKKNKKVPWYKKIKSPISIELSFEDGNFNIGASVDIGPFGIEVSTFDGGTFGLGVGVFDIEIEGDGSGKIGMLFDTFRMEVERVGCTYVKKTYFQDFLYHTEVQKIEGCKTDEEKEREENEEEEDNEDINEDINENDNEESEDEDNKEENNEEESEDEEENDEEDGEDEDEDDEEDGEDEDEDDEKSEDEKEDDEEDNTDPKDKNKIDDSPTFKFAPNQPLSPSYDLRAYLPSNKAVNPFFGKKDLRVLSNCGNFELLTDDGPLFVKGNQDETVLVLVDFAFEIVLSSVSYRNTSDTYDSNSVNMKFQITQEHYYRYNAFYDLKKDIKMLPSRFNKLMTIGANELISFKNTPFSYPYLKYSIGLPRYLCRLFSYSLADYMIFCRDNILPPWSSFQSGKIRHGNSNTSSKKLQSMILSLPGEHFPVYTKTVERGLNLDSLYHFYGFRLNSEYPILFYGTRKDINRRLKEGYELKGYNVLYPIVPAGWMRDRYPYTIDGLRAQANDNLQSIKNGVPYVSYFNQAYLKADIIAEIPYKPIEFEIIPLMETEKCCFTPDDREALMFNQWALQNLSKVLGVQPRPKSGNNGTQNAEQKAEATKNAVGFPLSVHDISNPKAIQNGRNTRYSKVIEEHDKINVGNYRELLLEILKLIQNQSMGLGIPKLRKHGFGVPKNVMEPTTDTSPDRAYDLPGILARMFAAIVEYGIPGPINLITKKGKEIIESQVYTNKEYFETLFALVAENLQVTRRNQITIIKLAQLGTTLHKISLITYRFIRHVIIPGLGIPFKRSANPDESVKHGQYNSYFTSFNFNNIIQKGFGGANSDEGIEMNPNFKPKTEDIDQAHDEANVPGNGYLSSVFFPGKTANLWMQIKALMKKSK